MNLDQTFWNDRWKNQQTRWDIGFAAPALVAYFEGIQNKDVAILIPGCGNAYEAQSLVSLGFTNITLVDIAEDLVSQLQERFKDVPQVKVIHQDFFKLEQSFDYIVEQTFFCALDPMLRGAYVEKMYALLKENGILFGVLFGREFETEGPPFGGTKEAYIPLFGAYFKSFSMEPCMLSIEPRKGSELFIECKK